MNARTVRSWGPWVLLAVALLVVLGVGVGRDAGPRTNAERVSALAESVRCPACRSQAVAESDAPSAQAIRREIARRVQEGESDGAIRAYLVSRFGDDILMTPPAGGVNDLVWALPVGALVLAAGGLVLAFRRWKVEGPVATAEDRARVERALAERAALGDDAERVGEGTGR